MMTATGFSWWVFASANWLLIMLDGGVKGTVILAAAGGAAFLLRRGSAAARHLTRLAAIASLILLPNLSAAMPRWRDPRAGCPLRGEGRPNVV